jgi:hydroxyacylglutathione hydrolase
MKKEFLMVVFESERVTSHIVRIRAKGTGVCQYLIEGDDRALLVDTGYGIGDLRSFVEQLTDKPYEVVITHGHVDHASGAAQFDKVYMSFADLPVARERTTFAARHQSLAGKSDLDKVPESEWIEPKVDGYLPLEEGQMFHLGNLDIETIHVPGHTPGMMVLLDIQERIAFFGDACGVFTMLLRSEASSVHEFRQSLAHLKEHEARYDRVLRQHGTCESDKAVLEENMDICDEVLSGEDDHIPFEWLGIKGYLAKRVDTATGSRIDGGTGNLAYRADNI